MCARSRGIGGQVGERESASCARAAAGRTGADARRHMVVGLACAVGYFIVLEAFLAVPAFNGATQIRPASGLGPVLGLFFGVPGVVGSAAGNLLSDALRESDPVVLLEYFVIQLIYDAIPLLLWRWRFPRDERPALSSASRIGAYLLSAFIASLAVTLLLVPFEFDSMQALNIHVVRLLNNFLALVYVGTPTLLLLNRLSSPRQKALPLPQRVALTSLVVAALASVTCLLAFIVPQALRPLSTEGFANLMASVYLVLSAVTVCFFGGACLLLHVIDRSLIRPIDEFAASAREFPERFKRLGAERAAAGELDVELDEAKPLPEIAELINSSNAMRRDLGENVLAARAADRERAHVAAELDVAASIQLSSVPRDFADIEQRYAVAVDARMQPAREVGGDFYDVFSLDDTRLCVLIADVSDKGVPAALFMMRSMAELRECIRTAPSLADGFTRANRRLCEQNASMQFVTAFAVSFDCVTGDAEVANAGHNPPWLQRADGAGEFLSVSPGLPLGAWDDFEYEETAFVLMPGDSIALYTDGITEARNAADDMFGSERLSRVFAASVLCPSPFAARNAFAHTVCREVECAVRGFSDGVEQSDDLTVVAFTWLPAMEARRFPADIAQCTAVQEFVRAVAQSEDAATKYALDVIVEELFANIAQHGYGEETAGATVGLAAGVDAERGVIHMVFQDEGVAFNPLAHAASPIEGGDGTDLQIGGMGLLMVQTYAEALQYVRIDACNVLHVAKRLG